MTRVIPHDAAAGSIGRPYRFQVLADRIADRMRDEGLPDLGTLAWELERADLSDVLGIADALAIAVGRAQLARRAVTLPGEPA